MKLNRFLAGLLVVLAALFTVVLTVVAQTNDVTGGIDPGTSELIKQLPPAWASKAVIVVVLLMLLGRVGAGFKSGGLLGTLRGIFLGQNTPPTDPPK